MCELVGLKVVGLKRVRIGRVALGDLPLGQWRYLREDERFWVCPSRSGRRPGLIRTQIFQSVSSAPSFHESGAILVARYPGAPSGIR